MTSAKQVDINNIVSRTVPIELGERSYDIHIGRGLIGNIGHLLPFDLAGRSVFIIADRNVIAPHGQKLQKAIESLDPVSVSVLELPAGEQTKSFKYLEEISSWLARSGVERKSVIFALGGGVIGDLSGFAAATMMRGVPYIQVPTTLLSQVDSSVGGKTAINIPEGKNLVGAFYQPAAVICDLDTMETLPRREILAGYAEIAKYGLINDEDFFAWLESDGAKVCDLDEDALTKAIEVSCRKKAAIVKADETEQGMRALLNLGHTFGHAIEAACGYDGRLLHGEAVAIGMVMAFRLSQSMGHCGQDDADRVEAHLRAIGLPVYIADIDPAPQVSAQDLLAIMQRDKKLSMGKLNYIVTDGIGKARVSNDVSADDVAAILEKSIEGK